MTAPQTATSKKKRENENPAILCAPSTKQQFSDTIWQKRSFC